MVILKAFFILLNMGAVFFLLFRLLSIIASLFFKEPECNVARKQYDFACIITAYKDIDVCNQLVESFINQHYNNFMIYLVADECDISTFKISSEKLVLLRPENKLGSKVRSMVHAIENFTREHECILILDPDNVAKKDFLSEQNKYFNAGYKAVQGKRTAKNLDSIYACLDAAGELYYNFTDRLIPFILRTSSTVAGSGMAIDQHYFRKYLQSDKIREPLERGEVIPAEDSILQDFLTHKNVQIAFAKKAILYDEKVSTASQVERQRTRWIFSYFENLPYALQSVFRGLFKRSWLQFYFGLNTAYPPLFLLVLGSVALFLIDLLVSPMWAIVMAISILLFFLNFYLVLKLAKAPKQVIRSIWALPLFVFKQILALLNINKARKDFLPTKHKKNIKIDELDRDQQ